MIKVDTGVAALTRLDDADVSLVPVEMGGLVVLASMGEQLMPLKQMLASWTGAKVDFSGYYRIEPSSLRTRSGSSSAGTPGSSRTDTLAAARARRGHRLPWPWLSEQNPFIVMAHSSTDDEITLVVDGVVRPVTDQALGSWLRQRFGLSLAQRSLDDPLVLFTCTDEATRQLLADELGRLAWFTKGLTALAAEPVDPLDRSAGGSVLLRVYADGAGRGGRLRSVYPRGPAGDRVRWAYRDRFAAQAMDWLLERRADAEAQAPAYAPPLLFGGGNYRGLSYFDRRDRASRSSVLGSSFFESSYAAWTPNPVYRPGTRAASDSATRETAPWNVRELGDLPFDPENAVVVVTYFAGGRFAVYAEWSGTSYWETPQAFGARLRKDLQATAAWGPPQPGQPSSVVLLSDFEAIPETVREQVAQFLDGYELITVNRPTTLAEGEGSAGLGSRIALLLEPDDAARPEWTATTPDGVGRKLSGKTAAEGTPYRQAANLRPAATGARAPLARFAIAGITSPLPPRVYEVMAWVNGPGGALARVSGVEGLHWEPQQVAAAMRLLDGNARQEWAHDLRQSRRLGSDALGWTTVEYAERLVRLAAGLAKDPVGGMWLSGSGPADLPPVRPVQRVRHSGTQTHLDLQSHNSELKELGQNSTDVHIRFLKPTESADEHQLDGGLRRKITPEQAEHFARIQQAVITQEDEHGADYYPFYHAQDPRLRVAQDIYKRVYARHHGEEVPTDFHFLRFSGPTDDDYSRYADIAQFVAADMDRHGLIDDNVTFTRSNVISVNLALYGGLNHPGEETFFYFQIGTGWAEINVAGMVDSFLRKFGLDPSGAAEISTRAAELNATSEGSLFQILVPRQVADEIAYVAHPHGLPHDDELLDDLHALSPVLYNIPTSSSMSENDGRRPLLPVDHEREKLDGEITRNLGLVRDVWNLDTEEPSPVPGRNIVPAGPHVTADQVKLVRDQLDARAEQRRRQRLRNQAMELHGRTLERFREGRYAPTRYLDDYVAHPERLSHPDLARQRRLIERNPDHFQGQGRRSHHEIMRVANRQNFMQARILLSANYMLNPGSGIKMFRYTTVGEENASAYELLLDRYVETLFADRTAKQQAPGAPEP